MYYEDLLEEELEEKRYVDDIEDEDEFGNPYIDEEDTMSLEDFLKRNK